MTAHTWLVVHVLTQFAKQTDYDNIQPQTQNSSDVVINKHSNLNTQSMNPESSVFFEEMNSTYASCWTRCLIMMIAKIIWYHKLSKKRSTQCVLIATFYAINLGYKWVRYKETILPTVDLFTFSVDFDDLFTKGFLGLHDLTQILEISILFFSSTPEFFLYSRMATNVSPWMITLTTLTTWSSLLLEVKYS